MESSWSLWERVGECKVLQMAPNSLLSYVLTSLGSNMCLDDMTVNILHKPFFS